MVPRPLAPARAMKSRTCADVFQPCPFGSHAWAAESKKIRREGVWRRGLRLRRSISRSRLRSSRLCSNVSLLAGYCSPKVCFTNPALSRTSDCGLSSSNRSYSYSRYWPGSSLKLRLMRGSLCKCKWHSSPFNDIPPHEPPLQASSRPIPRIRIWPIVIS